MSHLVLSSLNDSTLAKKVAYYFINKTQSIKQRDLERMEDSKYSEVLQVAVQTALNMLYAKNNASQPSSGPDFAQMVKVERLVIKLQAAFRGKLSLKKMAKDVEIGKRKLKREEKKKNLSNE